MSKLSEAAAAWVRAEYYFRLGPDAYSKAAQDSLIAAEEALRKAVSGKRGLGNAAAELGVRQVAKPVKARVRLLVERPARKGLFD
jgi:hypothetical protein